MWVRLSKHVFGYAKFFDIIVQSTRILIVSGGPVGLITFTALSNTSINVQVDKGDNVGQFETFVIYKGPFLWCTIPIYGVLRECTDNQAKHGQNEYGIGADSPSSTSWPKDYTTYTLDQNRTCLFVASEFSFIAISISVMMMAIWPPLPQ